MNLKSAKVYHDGSHFIAIPSDAFPHRRKKSSRQNFRPKKDELHHSDRPSEAPKERFETAYKESQTLPKRERKAHIKSVLKGDFTNKATLNAFVDRNLERVKTNAIKRKVRLMRKLRLQRWDYFVTFTYSDELHTEETFRKKLTNILKHLVARKGWKYVGVWERSPEKKRLHFHGILYIPDNTLPGEMIEVNDYSLKTHKRQITIQNTYFNEKFGRSDFEKIDDERKMGDAIAYLLKYIEKTGEKIVYSKGLPQYFISDVFLSDVVTRIGQEDKKLLLYDDFNCIDEGCIVGKVNEETIKQMPKSN